MNFEDHLQEIVQHRQNHLTTTVTTPLPSCIRCYPRPQASQISNTFKRFFLWLNQEYQAHSFTGYTVTAFNTYITAFNNDSSQSKSNQVVNLTIQLLFSLEYREKPLTTVDHFVIYLFNLTFRTKNFKKKVTPTLIQGLCADLRTNYPAIILPNMASAADLRTALEHVLGTNAQNLTAAIVNAAPGGPREITAVKIEPFHGRDDEDPIEWLDSFNRAAIANNSNTEVRKKQIVGGYLKDAAAIWFASISGTIGDHWNTGTNTNNNFEDLFDRQFASDAKKNIWYQRLMNLRQTSDESVDSYAAKFVKLANRVNLTDDIQKKRMFLFGLNPALTPMVHMQNPMNVNDAITHARNAEIGLNYATTAITPTTYINTTGTQAKEKGQDIDKLVQQMEQLSLNYAQISAALTAQTVPTFRPSNRNSSGYARPSTSNFNGNRPRNNASIKCYNCNQLGHISRNCPRRSGPPVRFSQRNNRGVNLCDTEYECYSDDYEEYDEDEEAEAYLTTRSRGTPYPSVPKSKNRRNVHSESRREENLRGNRPMFTQTFQPLPQHPEEEDPIPEPMEGIMDAKKKRKFTYKPAPIEEVTEFNIENYIKDLPSGLSIGQAAKSIPTYRRGLQQMMRRTREANYIGQDTVAQTTAAKCKMYVGKAPVEVIIDSGAATSIITKSMLDMLGYPITNSSNLVIITANGNRIRSLGEVRDLPINVRHSLIKTNLQVLESKDKVLILGNDWMHKVDANFSWKDSNLTINHKGRAIVVPVTYTRPNTQAKYEEEEEYSDEYEEEEIIEADAYYFSSEISSAEVSDDDLEYNPWATPEVPEFEAEKEIEECDNDIETTDFNDPAQVLAYMETYHQQVENTPDLHVGPLTYEQQNSFQGLLGEYSDICAASQTDIGRTNLITHRIHTGDALPLSQPPYRCNPKNKEFLRKEITKMEEQGLIRKSISPWAAPVVIVDKKGGDKRLCIDYRRLNATTKPDAYPLPRIDDLLESFRTAGWFTTLDLASGYWQVEMHQTDQEKTAFITDYGLYEFIVMPFGLRNAPGTFQRLMNHVLQDYLGLFVCVYLDDIIIYSKTFEQHLDHIAQVFNALRQAQLKIKLKKCYFCLPSIHFLGHVVGRNGIQPDPAKIDKIKNFPVPTNLTQLRAALGLFSYYRKFIKDFSRMAKPMTLLLRKETPFLWTNKQQIAFDQLKKRLITAPVLKYPDFEQSFVIFTDASGVGLGAVLSQKDEQGKEGVIAYASRSLNQAEQNYSVTDQECLAVVWAIKHFQHYLGLRPFTIVTDHSALKWLKTSKIPTGRRARWIMFLQQFDFDIVHRPGKTNANADALSRAPETHCYMMGVEVESEETNYNQRSICLTCGNVSGSKNWSRKHYYSLSAINDESPWMCDYAKDYARIVDWDDNLALPHQGNQTFPGWKGKERAIKSDESDYDADEEEIDIVLNDYSDYSERINLIAYAPTMEEYQSIFQENINIRHVVANQPIKKGGSKCTDSCDIENHHRHTYCRLCKRNLPYHTIVHDCIIGFGPGQIRPEMNPQYLINTPWWKEPLAVQAENNLIYLERLQRLLLGLPLYWATEELVADLD
jgi:hypothetical protein